MSAKKVFSAVIAWMALGVVFLVCLRLVSHSGTEGIRTFFKEKLEIVQNNFSQSLITSRRAPLSTIELQENLRHYLRVPFADFTHQDWNWFWHLMYGKFPDEQSQGWPKKTRQLSRAEVEDELAYSFQNPFGYFTEQQWAIFWQQIMKGKVF